jgi:putative hemolysin
VLLKAGLPVSAAILKTVVVLFITFVLSYFTLVLGELVPKRLALQKSEEIARFAVRPLHWLSRAASPFVKLLTLSTNAIVRLAGVDPSAHAEEATEEEIRMMVDVGQEKGTIDAEEKTMIHNVFEFDDKVTAQVMTHRTDMVALEMGTSLTGLMELMTREQYSRLPVYRGDPDHIIGILHVKDLLPRLCASPPEGLARDFELESLIRPPYRVPDSKPIKDLFREMKRRQVHLAVVIDEYGGTAGIVTIEDLLEELVGEIDDEYDQARIDIEQVDAVTWQVSGQTELALISDLLSLPLPEDSFTTLSGYIISLLGRVPEPGERIEVQDAHALYRGHALFATGMLRFDTIRIRLNGKS